MGIDDFIFKMMGMASMVDDVTNHSLDRAASIIAEEAKAELGTYQGAAGPTPAWSPLAESTQAERVSKGFPADEPLLRTGELRDSISYEVNGDTAVIGSSSPISALHEMGTDKIPQRSFLAGAAYRKSEEIADAFGHQMTMTIAGKPVI